MKPYSVVVSTSNISNYFHKRTITDLNRFIIGAGSGSGPFREDWGPVALLWPLSEELLAPLAEPCWLTPSAIRLRSWFKASTGKALGVSELEAISLSFLASMSCFTRPSSSATRLCSASVSSEFSTRTVDPSWSMP